MWWYRLLRYWTIRDYLTYGVTVWLITFAAISVPRLIRGSALNPLYTFTVPFLTIPLPLVFLAAIQRYSAKIEEVSGYPTLRPGDFSDGRLSEAGRILAFAYAEWCPFCRRAFPLLRTLNPDAYRVFRIDLSDSENPLWDTLKIRVVPTLVAFDGGLEIWRRGGRMLIGLRRSDFEEADAALANR